MIGRQCLDELRAKALDQRAVASLNARLAKRWNEITQRLRAVMLPTKRIAHAMQAAGAPMTATDLGLDDAFYRDAVRHAREIRNRFTILDLAADAGLLDDFAAGEA